MSKCAILRIFQINLQLLSFDKLQRNVSEYNGMDKIKRRICVLENKRTYCLLK